MPYVKLQEFSTLHGRAKETARRLREMRDWMNEEKRKWEQYYGGAGRFTTTAAVATQWQSEGFAAAAEEDVTNFNNLFAIAADLDTFFSQNGRQIVIDKFTKL